jgi:proteasome assembly chaperone (PAC2) family protein
MDGICLLCEIRYLDIPQPRSVQAVLSTLTRIIGIEIDMSEMEQEAEEMELKLEQIKEQRIPETGKQKEPRYIS